MPDFVHTDTYQDTFWAYMHRDQDRSYSMTVECGNEAVEFDQDAIDRLADFLDAYRTPKPGAKQLAITVQELSGELYAKERECEALRAELRNFGRDVSAALGMAADDPEYVVQRAREVYRAVLDSKAPLGVSGLYSVSEIPKYAESLRAALNAAYARIDESERLRQEAVRDRDDTRSELEAANARIDDLTGELAGVDGDASAAIWTLHNRRVELAHRVAELEADRDKLLRRLADVADAANKAAGEIQDAVKTHQALDLKDYP